MKNYHSKQGSQGGKKWAGLLTCQTILLVLIGLLVSISTNQAAAKRLSNVTQPRETPEEELAALKLDMSTVLLRYSRLRDNYASLAKNCSATVVNFTGCPEGWLHVLVNEKCFYFSNDKMDWPSSRDNCTSMGGHLSILHSKSAHEALEKEASRIGGFDNYFWIGLSDREMEGDWRWVDNTTLTNKYVGSANPFNNLNMTRTTLTQNISVAFFSTICPLLFKLFFFCLISLPLCDFNSILPVIFSLPLPPFPYSFWQPFSLEPDNNASGGVEGEDCVVLQGNTHAWSDVPCEFIYPRICQMDAFPITSP
uniref:C-type lectin domain-containing protein n=1 Tax=Oncorhynchus tshawytscha TaxID=74940 RepID=A0AAZ3QH19_ONCTS